VQTPVRPSKCKVGHTTKDLRPRSSGAKTGGSQEVHRDLEGELQVRPAGCCAPGFKTPRPPPGIRPWGTLLRRTHAGKLRLKRETTFKEKWRKGNWKGRKHQRRSAIGNRLDLTYLGRTTCEGSPCKGWPRSLMSARRSQAGNEYRLE
jgi:hypothetical protein